MKNKLKLIKAYRKYAEVIVGVMPDLRDSKRAVEALTDYTGDNPYGLFDDDGLFDFLVDSATVEAVDGAAKILKLERQNASLRADLARAVAMLIDIQRIASFKQDYGV